MRKKFTKRRILSCISQIFDPLGLIGPVMTNGKILMQNLWILRLQWDEIVPDTIEKKWKTYYDSLIRINDLVMPRSIAPWNISYRIILHGFSDASKKPGLKKDVVSMVVYVAPKLLNI